MTNPALAANPLAREILRSRLVLQLAIETSLDKSRKALLALNLAELAIETREQITLSRSLAILDATSKSDRGAERQPARANSDLFSDPTLAQVRASALRIHSATRLQLALLARSRQKLRVIANMLAGTGASYGPASAGSAIGRG